MSVNKTCWIAIDADGTEAMFNLQPTKLLGVWHEVTGDEFIELPKGILKQWGYDLRPGECEMIVGPDYDPSPR